MNAPKPASALRPHEPSSPQSPLAPATEGTQRYVWESRFGLMLIEVADGVAYVNGQRVEPAEGAPEPVLPLREV